MNIQIKHRVSGKVLFEVEAGSLKLALEIGVKQEANLREAYLGGANLGGADLGVADLRGADLREADLRGADLREAYLGGANLGGADLGGANLRGADLREADLRGADLREADLRGADLREADLRKTNLRKAYLGGAYLIDAGQDSRGYRFVAVQQKNGYRIYAGCRYFTPTEARKHWQDAHDDNLTLRVECLAKLELIDSVARARGWIESEEIAS